MLKYAIPAIALVALSGCHVVPRTNLANAQYWQRSNATSSIFLEGPKAQQMLQRDIAQCVTDVRELERLGALRGGVLPSDRYDSGRIENPKAPEGALELYETPKRDRYLYSEYYDYQDFETCMAGKGWERAQYLPYDQAEKSRKDYIETIVGQRYRTRIGERAQPGKAPEPPSDYNNLNH